MRTFFKIFWGVPMPASIGILLHGSSRVGNSCSNPPLNGFPIVLGAYGLDMSCGIDLAIPQGQPDKIENTHAGET